MQNTIDLLFMKIITKLLLNTTIAANKPKRKLLENLLIKQGLKISQ